MCVEIKAREVKIVAAHRRDSLALVSGMTMTRYMSMPSMARKRRSNLVLTLQ